MILPRDMGDVCEEYKSGTIILKFAIQKTRRGNPKFCVTAKSGANSVKFIMGGRRVKRLPPC